MAIRHFFTFRSFYYSKFLIPKSERVGWFVVFLFKPWHCQFMFIFNICVKMQKSMKITSVEFYIIFFVSWPTYCRSDTKKNDLTEYLILFRKFNTLKLCANEARFLIYHHQEVSKPRTTESQYCITKYAILHHYCVE